MLVLIDGDGAVFQEKLYQAATEGGGDAAHQLYQEVKRHVADLYPHDNTSGWNIMANVFCNVEGLVSKLRAVNILRSPSDFPQFARAFGLNQSLFSMIDVGAGKERADYKLREYLRVFLPNMHCKHVVLGGISHDNGYLPMLEPLKRDSHISSRISLLETYPAQPAFQTLGFRMFQCPSIFRSDNLPMRFDQQMTLPQRSMPPPPAPAVQPPALLPPIAPPKPSMSTPPSAPATVASPSPAASADSSWATVSKKPGNIKEVNLVSKKGPQQRFMLFNRHDERLDPDLPKADSGAIQRMFDRINKHKVCNAYHLNGNCDKGEYCDYDHGVKMTPGELLALKHHARRRCCPLRTECFDFNCVFGHSCPYGADCHFDNCFFHDVHHIEKKPAYKILEGGEQVMM